MANDIGKGLSISYELADRLKDTDFALSFFQEMQRHQMKSNAIIFEAENLISHLKAAWGPLYSPDKAIMREVASLEQAIEEWKK